MSQIIPYRSFTQASLAADFPALKLLFHADDYVAGALTWAARYGGITMNLSAAATKDANGVYTTVTNTVSSVTGTMPTLANGYAAVVSIGSLAAASAVNGITVGVGGIAFANYGLTSAGAAANNTGAAAVTAPTLTGSITAGSKACRVGYFDMVDTTSPLVVAALASASNLAADQAIANVSASTDDTLELVMGAALSSDVKLNATNGPFGATNDGRRIKIIALFDFSVSKTAAQIQLAAVDMAYTQELFAGWRRLAAAA